MYRIQDGAQSKAITYKKQFDVKLQYMPLYFEKQYASLAKLHKYYGPWRYKWWLIPVNYVLNTICEFIDASCQFMGM